MNSRMSGWTFEIVETDEEDYNSSQYSYHQSQPSAVNTICKQSGIVRAKDLEDEANKSYYQKDYTEAEYLYKQAIEAYGSNIRESIDCLYNLGQIYEKKLMFKEAEEIYEQAYSKVREMNNRPSLCKLIIGSLAGVYEKNGKHLEAEYLLMKVVLNSDEVTSLYHDIQYVEDCMNQLLKIYKKTNEFVKIFELTKKLSNLKARHFGYAI